MAVKRESLAEFWRYRELFYFFVWRDIKIRYKQTILGGAWAVIQPFVTMVVFSVCFGKFASMPSDGIPYPIFSFSGLVPWMYFSGAVSRSGNSLVADSNLLTKVYFPRIIIPTSSTLFGLVDFGIASLLLFGMMLYYHIDLSWRLLLWPVLVIPLMSLALGLGMILSSLNVRYRDINHVMGFVIQLLLFLTPIIYPVSIVPQRFRGLIALNPLSGIIDAFRYAILPTRQMDWTLLSSSLAIILLLLTIGIIYFRKTERIFADIV